MRRPFRLLDAGIVTVFLVAAVAARAAEVSITSVPKPALQMIKARFKDAMLVGAAAETTAAGKAFYEVSLKERGRNIDVTVTPEGALTLIEKQIALKDLPKPLADTLTKRYPRAKYRIVEQVYTVEAAKETLAYYEAILVDSKKEVWAVELGLDAMVRKIENKTAEEEE